MFRGETSGDLVGPYLSQFLWLDIPYGIKAIEQRYTVPNRDQSFLTDYSEWLACQRGGRPRSRLAFDATPRFICGARDLAEYVHRDFSFQAHMNAALITPALGKDALSPTYPLAIVIAGPTSSCPAYRGQVPHPWRAPHTRRSPYRPFQTRVLR